MFDFAVAQQQRRTLTGRHIVSWIASFLAHLALLTILIQNPELLQPGSGNWIRSILVFQSAPREPEWRTVTVLRTETMQGPSAATLKKYMKNWDEDGSDGGGTPPVRISWAGEEDRESTPSAPAPAVRPVQGTQEPAPPPAQTAAGLNGSPEPVAAGGIDRVTIAAVPTQGNTSTGSEALFLPAPSAAEPKPAPKSPPKSASEEVQETLPDLRPLVTAETIPKAVDSQTSKIFENEQSAIRTEGSGLFDTHGFPLGDYANIVIERVKGNWSIPSNMRNSQGRTTVVFFIARDGEFTDARIVSSSGSSSLDLAALSAVIGSNPFPPLPKGFPGNHVGAKFVFSYNERRQ
jgi:TonB family protein